MEGGPDRNTAHAYSPGEGQFVLEHGTRSDEAAHLDGALVDPAAPITAPEDTTPLTPAELAEADQVAAAEREQLRAISEASFDPKSSGQNHMGRESKDRR